MSQSQNPEIEKIIEDFEEDETKELLRKMVEYSRALSNIGIPEDLKTFMVVTELIKSRGEIERRRELDREIIRAFLYVRMLNEAKDPIKLLLIRAIGEALNLDDIVQAIDNYMEKLRQLKSLQ